jgi:hypothetical protein
MGNIGKSLAFILILTMAVSSLLILPPAKGQVESFGTSCSIIVYDVVEGQPVNVLVQMYPAPPAGEIFNNISVWITSPAQGVSGYGPWSKSNISSDTNGTVRVTFDIPTFSGGWDIGINFGGQYFANHTIYYQSGNWQRNFYVSSAQTSTPTGTVNPSPTPSANVNPSVPEFPILIILPFFASVILLSILFIRKTAQKR